MDDEHVYGILGFTLGVLVALNWKKIKKLITKTVREADSTQKEVKPEETR